MAELLKCPSQYVMMRVSNSHGNILILLLYRVLQNILTLKTDPFEFIQKAPLQ